MDERIRTNAYVRAALAGVAILGVASWGLRFAGDVLVDASIFKLASFLSASAVFVAMGASLWTLVLALRWVPPSFVGGGALVLLAVSGVVSGQYAGAGGHAMTAVLLAAAALAGIGLLTLRRAARLSEPARRGRALYGLTSVLAAGAAVWLGSVVFAGTPDAVGRGREVAEADRTLPLPDPGRPGPLDVRTYTYGSGLDRQRSDYAADADWVSPVVDGSALLEDWRDLKGWVRTRYWGFGPAALPLQGRVHAPTGAGPFPLVLIAHGNHAMEDFSDAGFAWLGHHLAGHGYMVVSVDHNFLNHTNADDLNPFSSGLQNETDARAWLLLEHLQAWRQWTRDPGHPMFAQVNWERVALIGHSRGGEAVATAALFDGLDAYPDDARVRFDYRFGIDAVVALAPDDQKYRPRGSSRHLSGVDYLTVHGGMDADVRSFRGISQYRRVALDRSVANFKASVYIGQANHAQFNLDWGRHDAPFPHRLFLDDRAVMEGSAQRAATAVFITAFLEASLRDARGYLPMFADVTKARRWLPDAHYTVDRARGDAMPLADFDEDADPGSATVPGARLSGQGLQTWRETRVAMKWDVPENHVVQLGWDARETRQAPVFAIDFEEDHAVAGGAALAFSAASLDAGSAADALDWSIVLTDGAGQRASVPLARQQRLQPPFQASVLRGRRFDGTPTSEPIFQRFAIPLAAFADIDAERIRRIEFVFDRSAGGRILLDDIAFEPE